MVGPGNPDQQTPAIPRGEAQAVTPTPFEKSDAIFNSNRVGQMSVYTPLERLTSCPDGTLYHLSRVTDTGTGNEEGITTAFDHVVSPPSLETGYSTGHHVKFRITPDGVVSLTLPPQQRSVGGTVLDEIPESNLTFEVGRPDLANSMISWLGGVLGPDYQQSGSYSSPVSHVDTPSHGSYQTPVAT